MGSPSYYNYVSDNHNCFICSKIRITIIILELHLVHSQICLWVHNHQISYGGLNWEMSLDIPLRPYFFLVFSSFPYAILKIFNIENIMLIRYAPKLFAIISSVIYDYFLLKLNSLYNPGTQKQILLLFYIEFAVFEPFSSVHSNNQEALLCLIAFYLWKTKQTNKYYDFISRFLVVIGFMCRLSIIMVWGIIWPYELLTMKGTIMDKIKFILKNILTIVAMISGSILFMYIYTGKWVSIEYQFMKFNFEKNISFIYGVESYSFFLISIIKKFYPIHIMLLIYAVYISFKGDIWAFNKEKQITLIYLILPFLVINSSLHKQFRFLLILYPPLFVLITKGFTSLPKIFSKLRCLMIMIVILINSVRTRNIFSDTINYDKYSPLFYISKRQNIKSIVFLLQPYHIPMYSIIHKNIHITETISSPHNYQQDQVFMMRQSSNQLFNFQYKQHEEPPTHVLTTLQITNGQRSWNTKNYQLIAAFGKFMMYQRKI